MSTINQNFDAISSFGLTPRQTSLLFSLERILAFNDVNATTNHEKKILKEEWIKKWILSIEEILIKSDQKLIFDRFTLINSIKEELNMSSNHTWYFLIILEAVTYEAYSSLGIDKKADKSYQKLKYNVQIDLVKEIISLIGVGTPKTAELYSKMYKKAMDKGTGKNQKIVIKVLSVLAIAAITAATAGALAGPIAVALFGAEFSGLSGAALVSACLAFAGGGAIAAGGAGMAGGVMVIVGGGAILGAASGGAAVTGFSIMAKNNPEFALSQAAKLDVVLREIILNGQKDVGTAQEILKKYKDNISEMNKEISNMRLEREQDKATIKNLKKAVEYMEKLYKDMERFTSSFEEGLSS